MTSYRPFRFAIPAALVLSGWIGSSLLACSDGCPPTTASYCLGTDLPLVDTTWSDIVDATMSIETGHLWIDYELEDGSTWRVEYDIVPG
jgi:hypothetical protein